MRRVILCLLFISALRLHGAFAISKGPGALQQEELEPLFEGGYPSFLQANGNGKPLIQDTNDDDGELIQDDADGESLFEEEIDGNKFCSLCAQCLASASDILLLYV